MAGANELAQNVDSIDQELDDLISQVAVSRAS